MKEIATRVKCIDKAVTGAGDVVARGGVFQGVCDVDIAGQELDVERSVAGGEVWIGEMTSQVGRTAISLEDIDGGGAEIGGVEIDDAGIVKDRGAFVDVVGIGNLERLGASAKRVTPAGDGAVLANKEKCVAVEVARDIAERLAGDGAIAGDGDFDPDFGGGVGGGIDAIESCQTRAVGGDPERAGSASGNAPGVLKVGIGDLGGICGLVVGNEIGDGELGLARKGDEKNCDDEDRD